MSADDLRARILRRFEGSEPRHELADWRLLGMDEARLKRLQPHFPENPIAAAVLVALVDRPEGLSILLTQRASQLAKHAAQISFPGGRLEESDPDIASAALREAQEEIGLDPTRVRVFGYLPDHLVISGYRVTPVLSIVAPPFAITPNPAEVEQVFEVPAAHVFDRANHKARMRRVGDEDMLLYDIPWQGRNIWGATAGMLLTLVRMVEEGA
ncbi:MAG TPA: CoA pyrophosphatase [Steroidobacteraceae bacterium]|nr:CoA pyrophosphatase [Steroidobacteraceae bacterium]